VAGAGIREVEEAPEAGKGRREIPLEVDAMGGPRGRGRPSPEVEVDEGARLGSKEVVEEEG